MDIVKYIAWLLPALLGFAGNWCFKFTDDDPDRPGQKRLTKPGKCAIVLAIASLLLAGYTTYSDQKSSTARAIKAEANQKTLLAQIDKTTKSWTRPLDV